MSTITIPDSSAPHGSQPVLIAGNTTNPSKAFILMHGRGASAESIFTLTDQLQIPPEYIILAPQAANSVWYAERFIVAKAQNQPALNSALDRISIIISHLERTFAITTERVVLGGFSQGACLVAEFLKQHPKRYQGAAIFSGGVIGDETDIQQTATGDLEQTPIYLGCDVADFHIPQIRVEETAAILTYLNGAVDLKLYEGLGHSIHPEGIAALQTYINQ